MQLNAAPASAQDTFTVRRSESEYQRLDDRYTLRMRAFGMTAALLEVAGLVGFAIGDPPHGSGIVVWGILTAASLVLSGVVGIVALRRSQLRGEGYTPDPGGVFLRF
ncbi:MAG: hypothetical protein KC593_01405 [Myxococcales bacterium]|nr:hypothetical protein [Myxococcales bacterium]MCB9628411.1 hypothetical protein [Sandaracinaceae bacterium]